MTIFPEFWSFPPAPAHTFTSLAQSHDIPIQLVWEGLNRELILYPPPPSLSHVPAELWLPNELLHGLGEGLGCGFAQEARLPVRHTLQGPPRVDSDNRAATVHRLYRYDPKMLSARGVEHAGTAPQQRHLLWIRGWAQECDTVVQVQLRCELFQFSEMLNVLRNSVIIAPRNHQVNACPLAWRKAAPEDCQSLQSQAQILFPLISVQREKQTRGALGEQPFQTQCFRGQLVKCACAEGRIEDVCLDTIQTMKGLSEDTCSELAVYQDLRRSTERLVHKGCTFITGILINWKQPED